MVLKDFTSNELCVENNSTWDYSGGKINSSRFKSMEHRSISKLAELVTIQFDNVKDCLMKT